MACNENMSFFISEQTKRQKLWSCHMYDKQNDFDFEIVNFPLLDGNIPRSPSYGVCILQLIRFARVCSNVDDCLVIKTWL